MSVSQLDSHRKEKQYQAYYKNGHQYMTQDTKYIHRKPSNLSKTYKAAWMKLLTENANRN